MKEIWKDIPGYGGLYQVSNFGNILSHPRNDNHHSYDMIMKQQTMKNGYKQIVLYKFDSSRKHHLIHRLVAENFIPNPGHLPQINHIDGNKANNCANNLEWCTRNENCTHAAYVLGREGRTALVRVRCIETGEVFPSIRRAAALKKIEPSNIIAVLKGRLKTTGGYHWEKLP